MLERNEQKQPTPNELISNIEDQISELNAKKADVLTVAYFHKAQSDAELAKSQEKIREAQIISSQISSLKLHQKEIEKPFKRARQLEIETRRRNEIIERNEKIKTEQLIRYEKARVLLFLKAEKLAENNIDLTAKSLGKIVLNVLTNGPIADKAPTLIEKNLEHFRERSNGQRILIGKEPQTPEVRLMLFEDGNFGLIYHPKMDDKRVFASLRDQNRQKYINLIGFTTDSKYTKGNNLINPFVMEKEDKLFLPKVKPFDSKSSEIESIIKTITPALETGSIQLLSNNKKLMMLNPNLQ